MVIPLNIVMKFYHFEIFEHFVSFFDLSSAHACLSYTLTMGSNNIIQSLFESHSISGSFSLSIRDEEQDGPVVKHYRIRAIANDDGGFYITQRISFKTLDDLVLHYKSMYGYKF